MAAVHIERSAAAFAQMVSGVADPGVRIPGGEWTVQETAAHLAGGMRVYRTLLLGSDSPIRTRDDLGPFNSGVFFGAGPDSVSGAELGEVVAAAAAVAASVPADESRPWHYGRQLPARVHFALLIDECLMHAVDVSRASGRPFDGDDEAARYTWSVLVPFLTPARFVPETAAGIEGVVSLECEDCPPVVFSLRDGTLSVCEGIEPDCVISGGAMQLLRWFTNRDTWDRSGLSADGPRPDLAPRFTDWLRRI